ncbi:MAG: prepilin-type N-terminal cleavage/methylation domain-containing protein [Planctomycetota bacterium]|nr:MAG: prepilin-type N-terminal cleavage/methylation domain-containing protein [Planctomycetota bacterium]
MHRQGFTLIEVLVVVAIIALLVAILIPSLTEARDHARSIKCMSNMQNMGVAVNTFATVHHNRFQIIAAPEGVKIADPNYNIYAYESGGSGQTLLGWPLVLLREMGFRWLKRNEQWGIVGRNAVAKLELIPRFELMTCPGDKVQFGTFGYPWEAGTNDSAQNYYFGYLSYGINSDICGVRIPTTNNSWGRGIWKEGHPSGDAGAGDSLRGQMDKVIRPSEVMMFTDAGSTKRLDQQVTDAGIPTTIGTSGPRQDHTPIGPLLEYVDINFSRKLKPNRHRRQTLNLCYADGHGGYVKKIKNNPYYAAFQAYWNMPNWRYLPKVRVSPHNPGIYPKYPDG